MSARELTEWAAYEQVAGPLGGERADVQAAMTAYYICSALGAKKLKLDRLLPKWDRRPDDGGKLLAAQFRAATVAMGGTVIDGATGEVVDYGRVSGG